MVSSSTASTPHKRLISNISSWKESQKQEQMGVLQTPNTEKVVAELLARAAETQFQAAGVQPVDLDRYKEQQEEQRQKRHFLLWLNQNGNLYPSREQKERLAEEMGTNYGKVNKLFANQRRRQHKQKSIAKKEEKNNHRLIFDKKEEKEGEEEGQHIDQTIESVWNKVMEEGRRRGNSSSTNSNDEGYNNDEQKIVVDNDDVNRGGGN
ncbi:unnamed protein product [Meloidogyne enterolobii]|uniref:Uncharacterized protein n=2 Tax=Meloidogyne enterolobii TaxID=390850 RepID=A0ACB1A3C9_MELEN